MSIASSRRMLCQQAPWSRLNFKVSVGPSVSCDAKIRRPPWSPYSYIPYRAIYAVSHYMETATARVPTGSGARLGGCGPCEVVTTWGTQTEYLIARAYSIGGHVFPAGSTVPGQPCAHGVSSKLQVLPCVPHSHDDPRSVLM